MVTIDVSRIGNILVYITHLGLGDDVQRAEVKRSMEFYEAGARKHEAQGALIFGDCNAKPGSEALDPIWAAGFRDVDANCYKKESMAASTPTPTRTPARRASSTPSNTRTCASPTATCLGRTTPTTTSDRWSSPADLIPGNGRGTFR
ncbi:hypothetical protein V5P93_005023 [Actinokineospora auranticolor]|uniref:hypothetical protein n=1 Tax=Actinokineospora auranticolor TaxID=155976 RepID=UPI0011B03FDC|nr:hypothetical protein [Actinokineospora auranticolor]